MGVYLGNFTFRELAEKYSIDLTDEELKTLESLRTDNANFTGEHCHIFDIPRIILCGSQSVFDTIYGILSKKKITGQFGLGVM